MHRLRLQAVFLRTFLPGALLTLACAYLVTQATIRWELGQVRGSESLYVGLGTGELQDTLASIGGDIQFLADHSALRAAIRQASNRNLDHLAEDFINFSHNKGVYDQVRWIDEAGRERVRVDLQVGGRAWVVPRDRLQAKTRRYYFTDTMQLSAGEVFVSPLDLNIEHGQLEVPYKPTLRIATPVFDDAGRRRGIVILNYLGQKSLDAFAKSTAPLAGHISITNTEGYWLLSPQAEDAWGFHFNRPEATMARRFPAAWKVIQTRESGQERLPDGLWTWATVHPLQAGQQSSKGSPFAYSPSLSRVEATAYAWKVVAHLPKGTLSVMERTVRWKSLAVAGLFIGLLGIASWKLARAWQAQADAEAEASRARDTLESTVQERTSLLTSILDSTAECIYGLDLQGNCSFCNHALLEQTGYGSASELIGRNMHEVLHHSHPDGTPFSEQDCTISRAFLEGRPVHADDQVFWRRDGTCFPVEFWSFPRFREGVLIGAVVTFMDITERKQAVEEHRRLQAHLQQQQRMESLGSLAGGVAHDMNNVLGAILGLASARLEAQPEVTSRRTLETIIKAAERGGKMVKNLLSFARQTTSEKGLLNLNELLEDEVHLLARTTLSRITLETDFAPDLKPIWGDASALTHALMNLCVNAVDAMPGPGTLTLRTRNVGSAWVEVMVGDTGTGMPKDILDRALDPYFTTKGLGKGTGLGLSLVYSTVQDHDGQLEIQSEPGRGTRVSIRIPAQSPVPAEVEAAPMADSGPPARPLKVLVVDDDELIREALLLMLESLGHSVVCTEGGEQALAWLAAAEPVDLVILDMNMPGLGGLETLPRLRACRPELPVFLATGRVEQAALAAVARDSRTVLLAKPFARDELRDRIRETLETG